MSRLKKQMGQVVRWEFYRWLEEWADGRSFVHPSDHSGARDLRTIDCTSGVRRAKQYILICLA
jgi:hypothetical protein